MKLIVKTVCVYLIYCYRLAISPFFSSCCRYSPTCSKYAIDAIEKYGLFVGARMAFIRILGCNSLSDKSGYDPVQ